MLANTTRWFKTYNPVEEETAIGLGLANEQAHKGELTQLSKKFQSSHILI